MQVNQDNRNAGMAIQDIAVGTRRTIIQREHTLDFAFLSLISESTKWPSHYLKVETKHWPGYFPRLEPNGSSTERRPSEEKTEADLQALR